MKIKAINHTNLTLYYNLANAYEAEFSNLTGNLPNKEGVFLPDTIPDDNHVGYLIFDEAVPIGFCVARVNVEPKDISEFYIVPVKRRQDFGHKLAEYIFNEYPGKWQVRQIEGANKAIAFWRSIISKIAHDGYEEQVVNDSDWGIVTRQTFYVMPNQ